MRAAPLLVTVTAALLAACAPVPVVPIPRRPAPSPTASGTPEMTIVPSHALEDEPFTTRVTGLPARADVTLRLSTTDTHGAVWRSEAVFRASDAGVVSTADMPVKAPYRNADPMGLVSAATTARDDVLFDPPDEWTMQLTAFVAGREVAHAAATRELPDVEWVDLTAPRDPVTGVLALPPATDDASPARFVRDTATPSTPSPSPDRPSAELTPRKPGSAAAGVVVVGGPSGKAMAEVALMIAGHGVPAVAVSYYEDDGVPADLDRVPLETFVRAAKLLVDEAGVDAQHVHVLGASRGGEAALLTAAGYPDVFDGAVAVVPPALVGAGWHTDDPEAAPPAWTLRGRPVATAPEDLSAPKLSDPWTIPAEKIRGDVVLVCGRADEVFSGCRAADYLEHRRQVAAPSARTTVLRYEDAGHCLNALLPYAPSSLKTIGEDLRCGGTPVADNQALAEAWPQILRAVGVPEKTSG